MRSYDEPDKPANPDTEITLGTRSILGIFFALVVICGVFFGLGYSLGHSSAARRAASSHETAKTQSPSASLQTIVEPAAAASVPKQSAATSVESANAVTLPKPSAADTAPRTVVQTPSPVSDAAAVQPVAYTSAPATAPETADRGAASPPTTIAASSIMVQIAAVSRRKDADALVRALRRFGYSPIIRDQAKDHLLHVQVGPFATARAAHAMQAKLIRSGYNAILK